MRALKPELVDAFAGKRVLVIGDLMLDEYLWGEVHRISPEAPVPVVRVTSESLAPGGAGNVAMNVAALGGKPHLHAFVGEDAAGHKLRVFFEEQGLKSDAILSDAGRPTTIKTRIIAHSQHVVRADREDDRPIDSAHEARLLERVMVSLERADAVVLSDYAKGVLTRPVIKEVLAAAAARGLPTIVDPAFGDVSHYQPVTTLKLNQREAAAAVGELRSDGHGPSGLEAAKLMGLELIQRIDARSVVVTCGRQGMALVLDDATAVAIEALVLEVYDVTGAGDTVTAAFALALSAGCAFEQAARLSNLAAGLVVGKVGTSSVSAEELKALVKSLSEPAP